MPYGEKVRWKVTAGDITEGRDRVRELVAGEYQAERA
jgi:hypothetical protein